MFTISDLRARPALADKVVDRLWRAFWKDRGHPRGLLAGLVAESLNTCPIPTTLIAHEDDLFLGTASVIACDEDSRPQYTPWIAAVWVEQEQRQRGIGAALVNKAADLALATGASRAYLAAGAHRRSFYEGLGWTILEADVPVKGMFIFAKDAVAY